MTNSKSTKRALLSSVLALVLCFAMLVGTTFAWFTDSAVSSSNKIVAGTLDVDLLLWNGSEYVDISESNAPIFGEAALAQNGLNTLWEPGKTQVAYLAIKNSGSLDLNYKVNLAVTDYTKNMYEVMEYSITPNAKDGETIAAWTDGIAVQPGVNQTEATKVGLAAGATHYFALSIHMNEEANDEYQGASITFDINVLASQMASESDSFNNQYDANATFPKVGTGIVAADEVASAPLGYTTINVYDSDESDHNRTKVAYATVPSTAVAEDADNVSVSITQTSDVDSNVQVLADQNAVTYEVSVSGTNGTTPITVAIRVGTGLTNVKLYHNKNGTLELVADNDDYDGEYVVFQSATFSPFTVVYDAVPVVEDDAEVTPMVPVATVTDVTNTINVNLDGADEDEEADGWKSFEGSNEVEKLDAVFKFSAPSVLENTGYEDWLCDFYVKFVKDNTSTVPESTIALGGNYGAFGWVGFNNPEVDANDFVPLLGSFDSNESGEVNDYWTYQNVMNLVTIEIKNEDGTIKTENAFICGVAAVDPTAEILKDAKFVVELRITNPDNHEEQVVVNRVTYTFGSSAEPVIENYPNI